MICLLELSIGKQGVKMPTVIYEVCKTEENNGFFNVIPEDLYSTKYAARAAAEEIYQNDNSIRQYIQEICPINEYLLDFLKEKIANQDCLTHCVFIRERDFYISPFSNI